MSGFLFEGIAKRRFERMSRKIEHWRAARAVRILSVAHPLTLLQHDPAGQRRSSVCADVSAIRIWPRRAYALHTQRATSQPVIGKGGNCVPTLKANQRALHKDAREWLEDPEAQTEMLSCRHVGCGHGRIETRAAAVSRVFGWLQDLHRWPDPETAGRIEAVRKADGGADPQRKPLPNQQLQ